jgi:small subunit ribosomal protein S17
MAHDEHNKCKPGDIVILEESAPISKYKKWCLKEIVKIYEKESKQGKKQVTKQEII